MIKIKTNIHNIYSIRIHLAWHGPCRSQTGVAKVAERVRETRQQTKSCLTRPKTCPGAMLNGTAAPTLCHLMKLLLKAHCGKKRYVLTGSIVFCFFFFGISTVTRRKRSCSQVDSNRLDCRCNYIYYHCCMVETRGLFSVVFVAENNTNRLYCYSLACELRSNLHTG